MLKFDTCYLNNVLNTTFVELPTTIEELYFEHCDSPIKTVEIDALRPFPNLKVLSLYYVNFPIAEALKLPFPFSGKTMDGVIYRKVALVSERTVFITERMMAYLKK